MVTTLWVSPVPSSAYLEGTDVQVRRQRACALCFEYENVDGALVSTELVFTGVEAFRCTYLPLLTPAAIERAYDRLIEITSGNWLAEVAALRQRGSPRLRNLEICFDDGPFFEFLCLDYEVIARIK